MTTWSPRTRTYSEEYEGESGQWDLESERINAVSPVFVKEKKEMMGMESSKGMPAPDVVTIYKTVVGGHISCVHSPAVDFTDLSTFINFQILQSEPNS